MAPRTPQIQFFSQDPNSPAPILLLPQIQLSPDPIPLLQLITTTLKIIRDLFRRNMLHFHDICLLPMYHVKFACRTLEFHNLCSISMKCARFPCNMLIFHSIYALFPLNMFHLHEYVFFLHNILSVFKICSNFMTSAQFPC